MSGQMTDADMAHLIGVLKETLAIEEKLLWSWSQSTPGSFTYRDSLIADRKRNVEVIKLFIDEQENHGN